MSEPYRSYTPAEKRERRRLLWSGGRQAFAGADTSRQDAAWARIEAKGEERGAREVAKARKQLDDAENAVAAAKVAERAAARKDRPDARQAVRDAQQTLRRAQTAARRYNLT